MKIENLEMTRRGAMLWMRPKTAMAITLNVNPVIDHSGYIALLARQENSCDKFLAGTSSEFYLAEAASTQQQREAAATLIDHPNGDILAWLKLARSALKIEPIQEQHPNNAHLSPSQIHALFALKDCQNETLLGWLELARLYRNDPTPMAFAYGSAIDSSLGNNLSSLFDQSDTSLFEAKLWTDPTEKASLRSGLSPPYQHFATNELSGHHPVRSSNSTGLNNANNHYWCTVCEELKSYKDSGNWKKHEKEHETIFICGLDDAAESSRAGQSHASKSFTCKRRDIMVNHLNKSHGVTDAHYGRGLADQWRHTVKKQAWSCGFCIKLFLAFHDRLRHVDVEHFKRHQSIHHWDLNKVILGLLQQPKMEKAWETRTASLPPWVQLQNLTWDTATAKKLRATLEIGPSDEYHATTLADATYSASKLNEGSWPQSDTIHANRHSDAPAQASFVSSQNHYHATSALTSGSGSYARPSPAITGPTAHPISGDPSCVEAPTSAFPLSNTVEPSMSSSRDEGRVDYNTLPFNPSQSWTAASKPGTFFNGYEQPESYDGRGADRTTSNWYDQ